MLDGISAGADFADGHEKVVFFEEFFADFLDLVGEGGGEERCLAGGLVLHFEGNVGEDFLEAHFHHAVGFVED